MTSIFTAVGTYLTALIGAVGDLFDNIIADSNIALFALVIPIASLVVGFAFRLIRRKGR